MKNEIMKHTNEPSHDHRGRHHGRPSNQSKQPDPRGSTKGDDKCVGDPPEEDTGAKTTFKKS